MDWYYPVLAGAIDGRRGQDPPGRRVADVLDGAPRDPLRADEPWVTASETAEASLAYAAIGDFDTATDLLRWTRVAPLAPTART